VHKLVEQLFACPLYASQPPIAG